MSQAVTLIEAGFSTSIEVYVAGTVSSVTDVNTQYKNATYVIKDEAGSEITVYRGKYLDGADFTSEDQIAVNDNVIVLGKLKDYNGTKEIDTDNVLVSLERPETPKTLGEIIATYGEDNTPVEDILEGIVAGTVFNFSAANAESIVVTDSNGATIASGVDTAQWIATVTEGEEITVTATREGEDPKTLSFMVEVVEPAPAQLGDIVVTYGEGNVVENYGDEITVEAGVTFTFSAANATNIKVTTWLDEANIVDFDGDEATYTFAEPFGQDGITVTATNGTDEPKTFEFLLTVTEPVLPVGVEYIKVKSNEEIVPGTNYILVGATAKAAKVGIMGSGANDNKYRLAADVTDNTATAIKDSYTIYETMDVCPFVIEAYDDAYALKLGNGNYLAVVSYSTSSAVDLKEASLGDKSGNYDLTRFSIEFADDGEATIKNGNLLSFNGAANPWRFKSYKVKQSPVYIYKQAPLAVPSFDEKVGEKSVSFTSTKGELHAWVIEYDANDNVVKENEVEIAETPASVMAKAPAADDTSWTNKVADEGVEFVIAAPETEGNYKVVRAKSVYNGLHSQEISKGINSDGGVLSGIDAVVAEDADAAVEYFNLQGVKVAAEQPGLYIRRQGGKVSKVVIR